MEKNVKHLLVISKCKIICKLCPLTGEIPHTAAGGHCQAYNVTLLHRTWWRKMATTT